MPFDSPLVACEEAFFVARMLGGEIVVEAEGDRAGEDESALGILKTSSQMVVYHPSLEKRKFSSNKTAAMGSLHMTSAYFVLRSRC